MKKIILIFILLIISVLLIQCEDSATNSFNSDQSVLMWIEHNNTYRSYNESGEYEGMKNGDCIRVNLTVHSDPVADLKSVVLNGDIVVNEADSNYNYPGEITFWNNYIDTTEITSGFDKININIETSIGKIEGEVSLPDTIVSVPLPDTLGLGETLTITWEGSNADYYNARCYYSYPLEENSSSGKSFGGYMRDNSLTIDGSNFTHDGHIRLYILPINGPFPEEGAKANLSGDGYGFVVYENTHFELDEPIPVGKGYLSEFSSIKKSSFDIKNEIHDELKEKFQNLNNH